MNKFKIWAAQTRANFLVLSVIHVCLGISLVKCLNKSKNISITNSFLLIIGIVLAHIAVNLFNEYSDYMTKIDFNTLRTPFSGGSGMLQVGNTKSKTVLTVAITILLFALSIGIYFVYISHYILAPIILLGGISIVFYTSHFSKWLIGEFFCGLTLGSLVVIGSYVALTANSATQLQNLVPLEVILISIVPGLLTALLLLINEIPDAEADKQGGRFHIVIWLGKQESAYLYSIGLLITYLIIITTPLISNVSWFILISLLTLPLAIKASIVAIKHANNSKKLLPALQANVIIVLMTSFLLSISLLIRH